MSDEKNVEKPLTLTIRWTDFSSQNLNARIAELKRRDQPINMNGLVEGVQFLRGVGARAGLALPMFYNLIGAGTPLQEPSKYPPWKFTQAASLEFSALQTISLICRAIFDDSRKGLTGKRFANVSDATLLAIAKYWADTSKRSVPEASRALKLLREVFRQCAQPRKSLLVAPSLLARRVGLLKYHADRQGAHITLETYLFHLVDVIHVVAAITIIGAIVVDFDQPAISGSYFNKIDEAGWSAAKDVFPDLVIERLFRQFDIHAQATTYWRIPQAEGLRMVLNQLPSALGYWDSRDETEAVK
jgi:hypothetical protein